MRRYFTSLRAPYILAPVLVGLAVVGAHLTERSKRVEAKGPPAGKFIIVSNRTEPQHLSQAPAKANQLVELPASERSKITGEGALDSASYFNCWITNRTSWTLRELRLQVIAGDPGGSTRWERNYSEQVAVAPGEVTYISLKVADGRDAETLWEITGARGTPPR